MTDRRKILLLMPLLKYGRKKRILKTSLPNEVALKLIDSAKNADKSLNVHKSGLTKRELEILKMIAQEMTNDEIAKTLYISKRTVDTHRQNLLNKLSVKNTAGLIKAAYALNLL